MDKGEKGDYMGGEKKWNIWTVKKMTIWMFEKDGHLDVGKKMVICMVKKMVIWMFEKDGHLDGEIDDNQV